jgi:hypothetical protein
MAFYTELDKESKKEIDVWMDGDEIVKCTIEKKNQKK